MDRRQRRSRYFRIPFSLLQVPSQWRQPRLLLQPASGRTDRPGPREIDQNIRKRIYAELQRMLAKEVPYINLWYFDNVLVHSKRVRNMKLNPSGNYDFLKTAELAMAASRWSVARQQQER